jgi:hypothetical protein
VNWIVNVTVFVLIVAGYVANREGAYVVERVLTSTLILGLGALVLYGILKLRRMQADFDLRCPPKDDNK